MVLKPEQERVRTLLVDTITLLCRNGLTYKTEFNINALIGITLDKDDVFLVDIRETIKNSIEENEPADEKKQSQTSSSRNSKSRKRRKTTNRCGDTSESETEHDTSSKISATNKSNVSRRSSDSTEPPTRQSIKQELFENAQDDSVELLIVKPEPGYRQRSCDKSNAVASAGDMLSDLAQQAYSVASSSDVLPGPSSWDPGQASSFSSQALNMSSSQGIQSSQSQVGSGFFLSIFSIVVSEASSLYLLFSDS